ncbi:Uncharacterized protein GBIM_12502 [Gryllus bimaculatus]|nr:Uncharacterized protein GBIM_12502 [Gryllus bimaculatus]
MLQPFHEIQEGSKKEATAAKGVWSANVFQKRRAASCYPTNRFPLCLEYQWSLGGGPSGAYSPDGASMGYMMDGQAQMMHRPPGDPSFHNEHYYPPQYYGHL